MASARPPSRETLRVVEWHLVVSQVDADWWQVPQRAGHGGDARIVRIATPLENGFAGCGVGRDVPPARYAVGSWRLAITSSQPG